MPAHAVPSDATSRDRAIAALRARFGDRLSTGEAIRRQHGTDESYHPTVAPDAVFFAVDTPQSCDAIREAFTSAQEAFGNSRKIVLAPAKVVENEGVQVSEPPKDWQATPARVAGEEPAISEAPAEVPAAQRPTSEAPASGGDIPPPPPIVDPTKVKYE